ncbi:MAG: tail fiber domain-containing protein [Pseudomonadota bacterium]|nr:tail fiber domain-containing protein [Pseudomonadota bacterium]
MTRRILPHAPRASFQNEIMLVGEVTVDEGTGIVYFGDGKTAGGVASQVPTDTVRTNGDQQIGGVKSFISNLKIHGAEFSYSPSQFGSTSDLKTYELVLKLNSSRGNVLAIQNTDDPNITAGDDGVSNSVVAFRDYLGQERGAVGLSQNASTNPEQTQMIFECSRAAGEGNAPPFKFLQTNNGVISTVMELSKLFTDPTFGGAKGAFNFYKPICIPIFPPKVGDTNPDDGSFIMGRSIIEVTEVANITNPRATGEGLRVSNNASGGGVGFFRARNALYADHVVTLMADRGTNIGFTFLRCTNADYSAEYMRIRGDGNVYNVNNIYGALSDAKLKKDIQPARSQSADVKQLGKALKRYRMKDAPAGAPEHLGLIAQDAELISPGLVTETFDTETVTEQVMRPAFRRERVPLMEPVVEPVLVNGEQVMIDGEPAVRAVLNDKNEPLMRQRKGADGLPLFEEREFRVLDAAGEPIMVPAVDEAGNPITRTFSREGKSKTKAVNYSLLYLKAVGALAEAIERIEALEAKLAPATRPA